MTHFRTITEDHEELQTVIFDIIKTLKLRYGSVLTSVKQQTPYVYVVLIVCRHIHWQTLSRWLLALAFIHGGDGISGRVSSSLSQTLTKEFEWRSPGSKCLVGKFLQSKGARYQFDFHFRIFSNGVCISFKNHCFWKAIFCRCLFYYKYKLANYPFLC